MNAEQKRIMTQLGIEPAFFTTNEAGETVREGYTESDLIRFAQTYARVKAREALEIEVGRRDWSINRNYIDNIINELGIGGE